MAANTNVSLSDYHKIRKMGVKELRKEANDKNINSKDLSESATRTLLMDKAGVSRLSTSGQLTTSPFKPRSIAGQEEFSQADLGEIATFTPSKVQEFRGWTKDIRGIPDIDIGKVKKYLLASNKSEFTQQELQCYRLVHVSKPRVKASIMTPTRVLQ